MESFSIKIKKGIYYDSPYFHQWMLILNMTRASDNEVSTSSGRPREPEASGSCFFSLLLAVWCHWGRIFHRSSAHLGAAHQITLGLSWGGATATSFRQWKNWATAPRPRIRLIKGLFWTMNNANLLVVSRINNIDLAAQAPWNKSMFKVGESLLFERQSLAGLAVCSVLLYPARLCHCNTK